MDVPEIGPGEQGLDAVGRYAGGIQELAVGRTGLQDGHDGNAWENLFGELLDRAQNLPGQGRRGRARPPGLRGRDRDRGVRDELLELRAYGFSRDARENAAVDVGAGPLRQSV